MLVPDVKWTTGLFIRGAVDAPSLFFMPEWGELSIGKLLYRECRGKGAVHMLKEHIASVS